MSTYLPQDRLLAQACDHEGPTNAKTCHYRKIFAILLLIEKVEAITTFIAEGVDDNSLPICFKSSSDGDAKLHAERPLDKTYTSFCGLDPSAAASFLEWQWSFLAPIFPIPNPRISEAPFHDFHENTVLPIIRAEHFNSGAFGTVYRVEIHQDYISSDFGLNVKKQPYFAIKRLRSRNVDLFSREVACLRSLNSQAHPNIVRLLASYKFRDDFHLLFPWADCDLGMFWLSNPRPDAEVGTPRMMLKQMKGVADALSVIHGFSKGDERRRWHGRHGDIKPSNILVFSEPCTADTTGLHNFVWKISDFGHSFIDMATSASPRRRDKNGEDDHTPVYRAPELHLMPHTVSSLYDIWSLGCVYLEAVTWLISGKDGLDRLASSRTDPTSDTSSRDAFFYLRYHPHSSSFTDDLLELITNDMLVVEITDPPTRRSSALEVYGALVQLCGKLEDDKQYSSPRCACSHPHPLTNRHASAINDQSPRAGDPWRRMHTGKRKRPETETTTGSTGSKKRTLGAASRSEEPPNLNLRFACPYLKGGVPKDLLSRSCLGPGWTSLHRIKEHLKRCHTPKNLRDPSACPRCQEGFKSTQLLGHHLREESQCPIKAPSIIDGQMTFEQVVKLQSIKRKSDTSDEEKWFAMYRILIPSHSPNRPPLSPYYEDLTVSSIDTLSTQSSTGIAEYRNYVQQPLPEEKRRSMEAEFKAMGAAPELCKALVAKFHENQLKELQEFDDKFKPMYDISAGGDVMKANVAAEDIVGLFDLNVDFSQVLPPQGWDAEGVGEGIFDPNVDFSQVLAQQGREC
ncbi:kinase-like domain-containing protein [Ilyonectria robusta]|uniref:kinase-like domain-containing protein n=1 Tax=Ilyonectria robusta TaxID=1079257 RepID=UPI001E8D49A4|nr:kinase-like domain-containing protein [Ilyonectria robusta]KAH8661807.1 kinase-like domain-containing protein [Ilyonectria robusta]